MTSMLIKNAEINGSQVVDLWLEDGVIAAVNPTAQHTGAYTIDAGGNAVLPGLHDHHLHFYALVAARASLDCRGLDAAGIGAQFAAQSGAGWLRGVGYHEQDAGHLDRRSFSRLCSDRPCRLQHASGKMWVLNDIACNLLALDQTTNAGVERDQHGVPTGRLFRMDGWLAARSPTSPVEAEPVIRELYSYGITGFTDTSFTNDVSRARSLSKLPFDIYCMGDTSLPAGHLKIMLDEDTLPDLDSMVAKVQQAHGSGRAVAFHCVSLVELLYLLEVMEVAGAVSGDRIEHGGVITPGQLGQIRKLGLTVVTQPGFLADRGGRFLDALDRDEGIHLYPYRSLLEAGIGVAASSDAPYGPLNPWLVISAAVQRKTEDGRVANRQEQVSAQEALRGYLAPPLAPGGPAREVQVGGRANLCLLDRPLDRQLRELHPMPVAHTLVDGVLVYSRAANTS